MWEAYLQFKFCGFDFCMIELNYFKWGDEVIDGDATLVERDCGIYSDWRKEQG